MNPVDVPTDDPVNAPRVGPPTLALQLYTIREALAADRPAALARVAGLGITAVESFRLGVGDDGVAEARALRSDLDAAGLSAGWAHAPAPLDAHCDLVLEAADIVGVHTLVVPSPGMVEGFSADSFADAGATRALGERLRESTENAARRGVRLAYHNHYHEFTRLDEGTAYDILLDAAGPDLLLELDVYWAQTGGADPATLADRLGPRLRALHLKDGPAVPKMDQLGMGAGIVDNAGAVLAAGSAELHVIEVDRCAGDVWELVEQGVTWCRAHSGLGQIA